MAISCPLNYEAVSPRLRTGTPQELSDWLSNRTPEASTALSDAPKADAKAIAASLNGFQSENLFAGFREMDVPCLLVYGEKDQAVTIPTYESATSTYTHPIILEGLGHFPMIDETIKFNRLLTDFLALPSGISPSELQMKDEWKRRVR
jgi:pimeloyl-ACP methyl ester carboxylesterase